jgi:glycosyltransferase involved in cell wall biosynthesis
MRPIQTNSILIKSYPLVTLFIQAGVFMKILYIADRINSPDGSSVHCRAFAKSAELLGNQIRSYPTIVPIIENQIKSHPIKKDWIYYLKKINLKTLKQYLHRLNPVISEIVNFVEGGENTVKDYIKLKRITDNFSPDVIIFRYRLFNFAPFKIAKKYQIPLVCEVNALKSMESVLVKGGASATILTRWGERKAISKADVIFTVSKAIKERVERYQIKEDKSVRVVPNGVDTDLFKPDEKRRGKIRSRLGLSGKRVLGYVGSYKTWHGLDTALDVVEQLAKKDSKFHLLLIGHGHQYDNISRKIRAKQLEPYVSQTGQITHKIIPEYISAFDYALMSYPKLDDFYFSPLKMFEYMAMGIQVVSTDVGQISEIITHAQNGWLVDPPSANQFCKVILTAEKQTHSVGENARKLMAEQYSWRINAEKILELADTVK